ncbi:hypothetical protein EXN66_Car012434 [Channa argus]|uniref:Uncharacterized protein n=1 Tax=Channa argus TaxID=215402 RepID=A0A6G1Q3J0_CHAAH|nr:hypothetical protein EXN66_Car012434 [Channa argus]
MPALLHIPSHKHFRWIFDRRHFSFKSSHGSAAAGVRNDLAEARVLAAVAELRSFGRQSKTLTRWEKYTLGVNLCKYSCRDVILLSALTQPKVVITCRVWSRRASPEKSEDEYSKEVIPQTARHMVILKVGISCICKSFVVRLYLPVFGSSVRPLAGMTGHVRSCETGLFKRLQLCRSENGLSVFLCVTQLDRNVVIVSYAQTKKYSTRGGVPDVCFNRKPIIWRRSPHPCDDLFSKKGSERTASATKKGVDSQIAKVHRSQ